MSDLVAMRKAGLHVAETAAPVLGFTLVYATTTRLPLALATGLGMAALVAIHRFRQARSIWPAAGGFALTAGAAAITALSGEATDFFLPVLLLRTAVVLITPIMLLLRWPPVGLAAGVLTGRGLAWRRCPVRLRAYTIANLVWVAAEGALVANQVRLYLADRAVAMGAFKLLVEVPVHVLLAVLMWGIYRRLTRQPCDCHQGERS
ncbi:DUF3159 domain-containing protein [Nonomuraea basaltis]|uniref:DUF3159 domain-containing protein n=1 Tax=Nonomuraea basaltis TaxID=2495887 RepID=UPI00110C5368|nr:DUF3159 domain-containing protein [Nonomuraea basaltis]TMR94487.1 DUF3159 domain-containing protein [Nonomuraea basaltis]